MTEIANGMADRRWKFALLAVGVLALAIGLGVVDHFPVGVFHDDAMYVILGRSLATGHGYRYLNIPGTPIATHFPPVYPAILAIVWRIMPDFPDNLVLFKSLNAVFFAATAVLIAQFSRDRLASDAWALGTGILSAISVPLLVLVTMVLSEPLFLALLVLVLLLAERWTEAAPSIGRSLALGALVGVLTLVRSHGVAAIPAVLVVLAIRRRWRDVAFFVTGALVVLVPWYLLAASNATVIPEVLAGNYGSYVGWWIRGYRETGAAIIPQTVLRTVPETWGMLAALFSPLRSSAAHNVTLFAFAAMCALGAAALRRRAPVTLIFLAGYALIVLLWPFPPSRFVWGVWPLLLFVLIAGAWSVASEAVHLRPVVRVAALTSLVWLCAGYTAYEWRAARGQWWASISRASSSRIETQVAWTRANTAQTDIIAAEDEGAVFLYTNRQAVPVASFTPDDYLAIRPAAIEAGEGLEPLLNAYPLHAVLVASQRTFDAAQYLAGRQTPRLALRDQFNGGAAFTVLTR